MCTANTSSVYSTVLPCVGAGVMVLSVDKDTYEQLGLQGQQSQYSRGQRFGEFMMALFHYCLSIFSD